MGYFIEAACAHFLMSGKTDSTLYKAAKKCANYWVSNIGPAPKKTWYDGHEEIKLALVRLARLVDETEGKGKGDAYITLAKFLLDSRKGGTDYDQSQALPVLQSEAVGHAVRASYLYTGMTDLGIELKNQSCFDAALKLWNSVTNYKMYVTGGVGSESYNEGFGPNYKLQNVSYDETCASCGMVFWGSRMNCAFHDAQYIDNLERQLYNVVLGSVDLAGVNFYYQNELDFARPDIPGTAVPVVSEMFPARCSPWRNGPTRRREATPYTSTSFSAAPFRSTMSRAPRCNSCRRRIIPGRAQRRSPSTRPRRLALPSRCVSPASTKASSTS